MPPEAELLAGYNDLTRSLPITVLQKQVTVFDSPLLAVSGPPAYQTWVGLSERGYVCIHVIRFVYFCPNRRIGIFQDVVT
jgi:hypothetical protein